MHGKRSKGTVPKNPGRKVWSKYAMRKTLGGGP